MQQTGRDTIARDTMLRFAQKTGLAPGSGSPVRYLWTDAYAVCNFLELHRRTNDGNYLKSATDLVGQVHETLAGTVKMTAGKGGSAGCRKRKAVFTLQQAGLRIGKTRPDRRQHVSADADLEWDRDGQYFHDLNKWMHALRQVKNATGDGKMLRGHVSLPRPRVRHSHAG